ncbi:MAG: DUF4383 domain-containing protein [Actinomycetota bacterium]
MLRGERVHQGHRGRRAHRIQAQPSAQHRPLALGAGWLAASRTAAMSKSVNTLFGAVLLVVAILGFTGIDLMHTLLNITESTDPDNFLHLVTGAIALYLGTAGAGARTATT